MPGLQKERDAMTGTTRSSDGLDSRRKKALLRSWRRGIREMDLILGGFADREIGTLTDGEIEQYEQLLDVPDIDFFSYVTGEKPIPEALQMPLLRRIIDFARSQNA
jgi:antitoxin CptB